METKYLVVYTFKTAEEEYGHGETEILAEKPLETQEELKEVARSIGDAHHGFVEVAINKVTEVVDD